MLKFLTDWPIPSLVGLLLALAGGGRGAVAVEKAATPKRPGPNILFLLSDDQRPDTIGALGNPHIQTPNLDALARRGVAMTRAVSAYPICVQSRAEILSGCSVLGPGVMDFGRRSGAEFTLWPQAVRDAGYHAWYVGKWHNDGRPTTRGYQETNGLFAGGGGKWWVDQLDWKGSPVTGYRGWLFQDDQGRLFPERGVGLTPDISSRFADAAIELIRRKPDRPFFLHVNFTAPHDPLLMPPGYEGKYSAQRIPLPGNFLPEHPFEHGNSRGRDEMLLPFPRTPEMVREVIAMYYAVITHMDEQIGRILAALEETGQADNTMVIFSSDQGLAVGSHGLRGKQNMYQHTVGVPLLIAGPGIPKDEKRSAQVYLRDLYPTACELAGIDIPPSVQGRSFAGVLAGRTDHIHPHVFCYFQNTQRMIRTDRWKLIYYPEIKRRQLFDLNNDPEELNDLSNDPKYETVLRDLAKTLKATQKEFGDPLAKK